MVASLSKTAQLAVQRALAQWQHWQCREPLSREPVAICQLDGGVSNCSVLVGDGARQFVLRLDGHNPQRLGLSRAAEWRAHQTAATRGLAPTAVYFNPDLGVLVSEYYQQDDQPLHGDAELRAIANLLRSIHSLPAVKFRLLPMHRASHYHGLLGESKAPTEFLEACERLQDTTSHCLCHNDLLRDNRLQHEQSLLAIDWEYVAMGDPWFDLAVVCEGDCLSDTDCATLSRCYLGAEPTPLQAQRLVDNRCAYRYLTQLWQRVTGL